MEQRTGCAATLAILAALGCYLAVCSGRPGMGILLSVISLPLGVAGLVMAASPRVSGGLLSVAAIVLGGIGFVLSLVASLGAIVF